MAKFRRAWCKEIQEEMTTEDVTDFIVEHGQKPTLMCPDERCRQEMPGSRIVSVCCDPESNCSPQYFRINPGHKHGQSCTHAFLSAQTDYLLAHKKKFKAEFPDAVILRDDLQGIETDLLPEAFITEFSPQEFQDAVEKKTRFYQGAGVSRTEAVRRARCAVPQKTSKLGLLVDMAIKIDNLKQDKRQTVSLRLAGRKCNYNNAFFRIEYLKQHFNTPYILCGKAIATEFENGFIIQYAYPIREYHPQYPNLTAFTYIDSHYRPAFLAHLQRHAISGDPFYLYSFSRHVLSESNCPISADTKRCVVIEPRTRDSVVIRSRCLKKEENSTF